VLGYGDLAPTISIPAPPRHELLSLLLSEFDEELVMDITFKQLEIFRWVVVAGSITKASHRIGLSQPSISQQLAKLEETLDVQLIIRNRTGLVSMTPAGEYWFKASEDILGRMAIAMSEHEKRYKHSTVILRLGATPVLRGRFTAQAARIAQSAPGFVKFELIYDLNSGALVEQLRMHQINFAIVAEQAILSDQSSFATTRLFDDKIAWAVPAEVSDTEILAALNPAGDFGKQNPIMANYVEIDAVVPTRPHSDDWFRHFLPQAMATFSAPTFAASIELVAGGLGTCHVPLSLLPNLSQATLNRVKLFRIKGMERSVVLAMRKHLLTHAAYSYIFNELAAYCRTEYLSAMHEDQIPLFDDLLQQAMPAQSQAAE
jgi:DNA-binding transcriptional LysR family regulator